MYKIAIDVGGTNTDAVLTDYDGNILGKTKQNTTLDIHSGISKAIEEIVGTANVDVSQVKFAMLGTTQCTNAIVERQKLKQVVSIRLATEATKSIKQYCDWPVDLREKVEAQSYIVDGGYEYDGQEISPINKKQIEEIVDNATVHNYAISGVFSPLDKKQEIEVRDIIKNLVPDANISLSHEIGSLSLLERENATILNSSLQDVIQLVTKGFKAALADNGIINATPYICQNDGTIMNLQFATTHPILTISSGPTNSIRGGGYLSGCKEALIVDIGGTTTDIGAITKGLARESQGTTKIGGVESNFRMPDMISVGLGGGTIVTVEEDNIKIGPQSVGYKIVTEAKCFGGDILTLSDIAKTLGRTDIGNCNPEIDIELAKQIDLKVNQMISDATTQMKVSADGVDIILVGGGVPIVNPDLFEEDYIKMPEHSEVANAIGASIAQTSGSYELLTAMKGKDKDKVVNNVIAKASQIAIESGADKDTIEVVEVEKTPLAYHPEEAYVIKTKVIGDLLFN